MKELTILNNNKKNLSAEIAVSVSDFEMRSYKIESRTYGPFGPVASFELLILDKNDTDILMDLAVWRASPLYKVYERFNAYDTNNADQLLDIGFALVALLKHPFAKFKVKAFKTLIYGEACAYDAENGFIRLDKSAIKSLVSAARGAAEYAYLRGDKEQQDFWHDIFAQNGARYSDGMISNTFGYDGSVIRPCRETLMRMMPKIERLIYAGKE